MISFRFKKDIHGDIFATSVHDFNLMYAAEFYANSTGLYYRPEFPYNSKWTCIDADFRLSGSDDYRRKKLRRAIVMSFNYRNALKDYIASGGELMDVEIDAICSCVSPRYYKKIMDIITGGKNEENRV